MAQLRATFAVPQTLEIAAPRESPCLAPKPLGQRSSRLDAGNIPCFGHSNGQHSLRPGEPLFDGQFVGVFPARALKAAVMNKKPGDLALPGAGAPDEDLDVSLRQGPQPAPPPTQHAAATSNDLLDGRFASQKAPGKHSHEGSIRHGRRRQNAPTSQTLREKICASAQWSSRDEFPALHVALGYPQRG